MEIGLVKKIDIDQEMQQAYLDYAMSVIVSRALPDARDGLKPVHRRILYAMYDMGLRPNTSHKKSARVVGEVLGKYHPHSDTAVYDAMARMAQDFSMRYPLVDGQGNFGSVDGDPPAAMRYTEARLASPALDIMTDIQKDTVDFTNNFDESLQEPSVLPAILPNMLINGATGIAVGMATNIPPHNINEVVDAISYILGNWSKAENISSQDLMKFVKGPDFPTGGIILGGLREDGLMAAYATGRGRITVQARAHIEEMGRGRQRIIVTELPYMTNKSSLIERIAKLAREGSIDGISDLRDESDRQGMRIVIEVSKSADAEKILEGLYRRTPMQGTFSIIMLALVNGEPTTLGLKQSLMVYINHRLEIIRRRSEHDLAKARARSHILEGLRVALKNLDEIITLIRKAADAEMARDRLMKRYKLSDIQANAILDMPLRRLAALERKKIEIEYKQVQKMIKELEGLLKSPKKMRTIISQELEIVKENYGDRRRTQIVHMQEGASKTSVLTAGDLAPAGYTHVVVTKDGLVSRTLEGKTPRPSGRAAPRWTLRANARDTLYLVSTTGKTAAIAVHSLPEAEDPSKGVQLSRVSPLKESAKLAAIFSLPPTNEQAEGWFVVAGTKGGMVKKSELSELPGPSSQTFTLIKAKNGDEVGWVELTNGKGEIIMAVSSGMTIRFSENEVRPMGLVAAGVNAIKLKVGDEVVGMQIIDPDKEVFLLASNGHAKRIKVSQFPVQGRYGQGVAAWKLEDGIRLVGMANDKSNLKIIINLARAAAKSARLDDAPIRTRQAKGKSLLEVKEKDSILNITIPWEAPSKIVEPGGKPKTKADPSGKPKKKTSSKQKQATMNLGDTKAKPKTKKTTAKKKVASKKKK